MPAKTKNEATEALKQVTYLASALKAAPDHRGSSTLDRPRP